ncbi:hypothetical protein AVEN_266110-1 [Araneus ventricosus]|uniref:DUF19 domain-containing protein n=1 Tax=Araneus ventricosus TaxID=182803 RepID=A0A4Y2KXN0_ARAVE|nr:hypothetical protein AVEN_266110-1 [Araneus ventricosus]
MKFLIVVILLSFGEPFAQSQVCELNPMFFCSFEIEPFLQSPPEDEDSLVHLCGLFVKYFRCMRTFATKCDKSEDYRPYKYIQDARNFVGGLCFEGSFLQQDYLRFAKCYKNAMPEIRPCQEKFDTDHDYYFSPYEVKDPETIEDICKKHRANVGCISEVIRMKCGGEAKHVFLRIVQLSKYLLVTCPKFDEVN